MRISDWSSDVCSADLTRKARTVADRLRHLPGVIEAEASAAGTVRVEFSRSETTEADISKALADIGVQHRPAPGMPEAVAAKPPRHDHAEHDPGEGKHEHAHGGLFGPTTELIFSLICGGAQIGRQSCRERVCQDV